MHWGPPLLAATSVPSGSVALALASACCQSQAAAAAAAAATTAVGTATDAAVETPMKPAKLKRGRPKSNTAPDAAVHPGHMTISGLKAEVQPIATPEAAVKEGGCLQASPASHCACQYTYGSGVSIRRVLYSMASAQLWYLCANMLHLLITSLTKHSHPSMSACESGK